MAHRNDALPKCICGDFRYEHVADYRECQNPRCDCKRYEERTAPAPG